jgi:2-amino-4-hydroxy-6-hydroxymethyldihydropteridine diphosphokinase
MSAPLRTRRTTASSATVYLGLGSNVGDREAHLRGAVKALAVHGVEVEALSSLYETEPVGEVLDQRDFLNAVVRVRTSLEPEELLDLCKTIEVEHGRMLGGQRHGPRPLDLDMLIFDDLRLDSDRLTLPHPEVVTRRFVLEPLVELDPKLALPDGSRVAEALEQLGGSQRVERVGPFQADG